jgi:hypothetical protein
MLVFACAKWQVDFNVEFQVVKRRLMAYVNDSGNANWPSKLQDITAGINHSPCISIGNLLPAQVQSPLDEPKVRAAKAALAAKMSQHERDRYFPAPTPFDEIEELAQQNDNSKKALHKGEFVYKDKIPEVGTKGTDEKRSDVYVVSSVLKNRKPPLYKLLTLNFHQEEGTFYRFVQGSFPTLIVFSSPSFAQI